MPNGRHYGVAHVDPAWIAFSDACDRAERLVGRYVLRAQGMVEDVLDRFCLARSKIYQNVYLSRPYYTHAQAAIWLTELCDDFERKVAFRVQ